MSSRILVKILSWWWLYSTLGKQLQVYTWTLGCENKVQIKIIYCAKEHKRKHVEEKHYDYFWIPRVRSLPFRIGNCALWFHEDRFWIQIGSCSAYNYFQLCFLLYLPYEDFQEIFLGNQTFISINRIRLRCGKLVLYR